MKVFLTILITSAVCFATPVEKTDEKPQKFDSETILKNDKAVQIYVNCFVNKGQCPTEAKDMKAILPDAFTKDCSHCDKNIKANTYKLLEGILKKKPELYAEIEKVYDPKGELKKKFAAAPHDGKKEDEKKKEGEKKKEEEKKVEGDKKKEEEKKKDAEKKQEGDKKNNGAAKNDEGQKKEEKKKE